MPPGNTRPELERQIADLRRDVAALKRRRLPGQPNETPDSYWTLDNEALGGPLLAPIDDVDTLEIHVLQITLEAEGTDLDLIAAQNIDLVAGDSITLTATTDLQTNLLAAATGPVGTIVGKIPISNGGLVGFLPVYDAIT